MGAMDEQMVLSGVHDVLFEIFEGAKPEGGWILNPGSEGLLGIFDRLSAEQASRRIIIGRPSIAAHANHVRFSLNLLNRWAGGEEPFSTADWASSWAVQAVTAAEWEELRNSLRSEARAWMTAVPVSRTWEPVSLTGTLASGAHFAYHMGAVRQMVELLRERGTETPSPTSP